MSAYKQGAAARNAGLNLLDNPYIRKPRKTISQFSEWEIGWIDADRDFRKMRATDDGPMVPPEPETPTQG